MAFDGSLYKGGNGDARGRYMLGFFTAYDWNAFWRDVKLGLDGGEPLPPTKFNQKYYQPLGCEFVDEFNPRDHALPENCGSVLIRDEWEGQLVGLYLYGEHLDWQAAQRKIVNLAIQNGIEPLMALPPKGIYAQFNDHGLTPVISTTLAILAVTAKRRPVVWENTDLAEFIPEAIAPR